MSNFDWKHGFGAMDQEEKRFLGSRIGRSSQTLEHGG
jgi:hypothetical protein